MLERLFRLSAHGTTARREVLGGVTTFATMAYIIVVNPAILSFAGLPAGPGTVATILAAVFGTLPPSAVLSAARALTRRSPGRSPSTLRSARAT